MPADPVCPRLPTRPSVPESAFVAPSAELIGAVELGERSSVWYQCVLRADLERIVVGPGSNLQDGTIVHLASDRGTYVGSMVTVGHRAILHACEVDDESLVGMGAILMDGAKIGARSIVAAGALVTRETVIPPGSMAVGSPARVVRSLSLEEQRGLAAWAEKYIRVAEEHRERLAAEG